MAATSPYTTATEVARLLINLFKGAAPSAATTPTLVQVDQAITWSASQVEMAYAEVGYIIPFADYPSETWPTYQTTYLGIVNALGAGGFCGGHMLRPAPAIGPGKGQQFSNLYQELFSRELESIVKGKGRRFRADYYPGTPAEQMLCEPEGPRTNFMDGVYNPAAYQGIWELVDLFDEFREDIVDLDLDWDFATDFMTAMQL